MALFQLGLQGYKLGIQQNKLFQKCLSGEKNNNHHHHQNKAFQQFPAQSYSKYPTASQLAACWLGGDSFPLEMVPQEPFCTGWIGRMTQSREGSDVEAPPLTLRNPSPIRAAKTCCHPAKPPWPWAPAVPSTCQPFLTEPKSPPCSSRALTVLPGSPEERDITHLSVAVLKVQQPALFPDCVSISGRSVRRVIHSLSTAQTAQLPPPPLSLWTSHPHRHWEGWQLHPAPSTKRLRHQKKPFCSPGCCRAHHRPTLPSVQAFDK